MAQSTQIVHVEGLDELTRAFARVDKGLRRQMQKRLRKVGDIVTTEARQVAEAQRLVSDSPYDKHKGLLVRQIRPTLRGGTVYIRDTARTPSPGRWGNYNYPARYEYQHGGARSFLRRGLEHKTGAVINELEQVLTWISEEWGKP